MFRTPVLLAMLCLAACARPVEPSGTAVSKTESPSADAVQGSDDRQHTGASAAVTTDRSSYVLTEGPQGPEATIVTTLHAPADRAVHLVNCNGATGVSLQRRIGEEWVYAWTVAMNACLSPAIVVPPGGEHTAELYLHEHSGGVTYPPGAPMIESGTYRVVRTGVRLSFDPDVRGFGPELPLEQRVSAPFSIRVP